MSQRLNLEIIYDEETIASAHYFCRNLYSTAMYHIAMILDTLTLEEFKVIPASKKEQQVKAIELLRSTDAELYDFSEQPNSGIIDIAPEAIEISREMADVQISIDITKCKIKLSNLIFEEPTYDYNFNRHKILDSHTNKPLKKAIIQNVDFNPLMPLTFEQFWKLFNDGLYNSIDYITYKDKVYYTDK